VHGAIAVTVIANRAVELVIAENPIKRFALGFARGGGIRSDTQAWRYSGSAGAHELAINLHHTGVAGLNWTKLRVIANLR